MTAVEFPDGTTPDDVWLDRYRQVVYRVPDAETHDAPDGHEPTGDDLYIAPVGPELARMNGADVELVEAVPRDEDLGPDLVADLAGQLTVDDITKDRQLATFTYEAIREAGRGPFLATPNGDLYVYDDGVWRGPPTGEQRLRELADRALGANSSINVLRELMDKVRARDTVAREDLGRPPGTVATPDGLLDLRTGETRDLRPKDYALTRIQATPAPDVDYAGSRWAEFIEDAVPDAFERAKLQEYAGYTLLPSQPFKRALFLIGPTDAGKGVTLKAIEAVLGPENVAHQPLSALLDSRWGTDKIHGKMANLDNEVSPKAIKRVEAFKRLTGGEDTVTAERKGQPTYEFTVTTKFIWATNQFPRVPHADDAFWNRCLFVEFPESVPAAEQDPALLDALRDERDVILSWMLEGLDELLDAGQFTAERDLDDRRALTMSFGGPIEQFIYEALEVTGDRQDVIHKGDLYDALARFVHFHEFDETPPQQTLTKQLTRRPGVGTGRSRRIDGDEDQPHVYQGLRPVEDAFRRIQADVPAHAAAEDAEQRDQQAFMEDRR